MKRSLVLSLCAVALAAIGLTTAEADVDVALNIRYTDPADPNEGGTWTLVAKTDDPNSTGLAALVARFQNIPAAGTVDPNIGHDILSGVLGVATFGSDIEFTYGQDPNGSIPGIIASVGQTGGPSDQGTDPLDQQGVLGGTWDNASVIATGSLAIGPGNRPIAVISNANETINGTITAAVMDVFNVRGDSVRTLGLEDPNGSGLKPGDGNRDGAIDFLDVSILSNGFTIAGTTWDTGDFNDSGDVDFLDVSALSGSFSDGPYIPPAIGGVPEPTTLALLGGGVVVSLWVRRRKQFQLK